MSYVAPVKDMLFNIEHLAQIAQIAQLPGFEDAGLDTAQAKGLITRDLGRVVPTERGFDFLSDLQELFLAS